MKKKTTITFLIAGLLVISGVKAQSLQEGIANVTADRFKAAIGIFDKLIAANPNNWDAVYWKGQAYLDDDNNDAARQLYASALQASNNSPLILVGVGHVELLDSNTTAARQHFETAITLTRTKKGDDPAILYAIGRANVDAKKGDFMYAIEKLEAAALRDPTNAEILLQLGNAYRKARPGEGGGKAYENYNKALQVNPSYANASVRLAKLFESQKNWELMLQWLNDAIKRDPKFTPAYYELFFFSFQHDMNFPEAEALLNKYINSKAPETDIQDQYLYGQLCWAKKDFDCAITKAESVVTAMGDHTKPKVYKLLADAYNQKGDYTNAKKYVDLYFSKEKSESIIALDYKLKADILSKMGASCDDLLPVYMAGLAFDSVAQSRIDYLTVIADSFKARGCKKLQADVLLTIFKMRPKPQPGGLINIGIIYSQTGDLVKADSLFKAYSQILPDSIYGYYWSGRVNFSLDTTMSVEPFVTNMVQAYQKTLEIAETDKVRFKSQGTLAAQVLAGYFNNIKSDKTTALTYANRGLIIDSTHSTLKYIKQILEKPTPKGQTNPRGNAPPKPSTKPVATKTEAIKTTAVKTAVKK